MNAYEANAYEALLHAGATRTTGTLLSRLAVPCHSRRGHGEDGVMVAPQSLGELAERPLLRCCAQHVARAWSSEFRPRGTAAGIRTRRPHEMRDGVRSGPGAHSGLGCTTGWQSVHSARREHDGHEGMLAACERNAPLNAALVMLLHGEHDKRIRAVLLSLESVLLWLTEVGGVCGWGVWVVGWGEAASYFVWWVGGWVGGP